MSNTKIILLTESPAESWKRDASTFALAFACFFPGWFLGMVSLSILGVLIFLYMTGKSVFKLGKHPMTPDEARREIDRIESGEQRDG